MHHDKPKPKIKIEVVYADSINQNIIELEVGMDCTVREAIQKSNIVKLNSKEFATDLSDLSSRVGIFGKLISLETLVKEGDRIEIYRPLIQDPKKLRRDRAKVRAREQARDRAQTLSKNKKDLNKNRNKNGNKND